MTTTDYNQLRQRQRKNLNGRYDDDMIIVIKMSNFCTDKQLKIPCTLNVCIFCDNIIFIYLYMNSM